MLHLSTKNLQRFEFPPRVEGDPSPLVALYAVASMSQLAQLQHDMEEVGIRLITAHEMRGHLREYLLALVDDDADRKRALHLLDARDRGVDPDPRAPEPPPTKRKKRKGAEPEAEAADADQAKDAALMAMVRRTAAEVWAPYRKALADIQLYDRMGAMCAVRLLLRGVEGPEAETIKFSAPHGIVDEGTLRRLGWPRIVAIGRAISSAMQVSETEAKN